MIAAGVAVMFSVYLFDFFKGGYNGLIGVLGMEVPDISIIMTSGVDGEKFCDEIRKFPEVEKVLLTRATENYVERAAIRVRLQFPTPIFPSQIISALKQDVSLSMTTRL